MRFHPTGPQTNRVCHRATYFGASAHPPPGSPASKYLAISLASFSRGNFATAARVATEIVQHFENDRLHGTVLLNINVPDIDYSELQGMEVTRLGRRHKAEPVVKSKSPRGETVYWVGAAGPAQDAGEGTDFLAIQRNRVSITPLQIDLTRYGQ